jgi:hypothetical protein
MESYGKKEETSIRPRIILTKEENEFYPKEFPQRRIV